MNVFEWSGPHFLLFYVWLSVVLFLAGGALRRRFERSLPASDTRLDDPLLAACLCGGVDDAIRFCSVELARTGVLAAVGNTLRSGREPLARERAGRSLERAISDAAQAGVTIEDLVHDRHVRAHATPLETKLSELGFCALPRMAANRVALYALLSGTGTLIALQELRLTIERGQNEIVGWLIALVVVLWGALAFAMFPRRTALGDREVQLLHARFADAGAADAGSWQLAVLGVSVLAAVEPALAGLVPSVAPPADGEGGTDDEGSGIAEDAGE